MKKKEILSLFLSTAMFLTLLPQMILTTEVKATEVKAPEDTSIPCEHHTVHDEECGYLEGTPEKPCTHEHTDACYTLVTKCIHVHTEECFTANETETVEPANCTHDCNVETDCITEQLNCTHEHDEICGYQPAKEGTPCTFECSICNENNAEECICEDQCIEDNVNMDCPVCSNDKINCLGETENKLISKWMWNNPEEILVEDTLALPGTNEENAVSFEDIVALLPTTISAIFEETNEDISITWRCENYPIEAYEGRYTFIANLPEGYAFAEETKPLRVTILLGGGNLLAENNITAGDFILSTDDPEGLIVDIDYTYKDKVLTIMSDKNITISGNGKNTGEKILITGGSNKTANIVLKDVDISVWSSGIPISFIEEVNCNLTLEGTNSLYSFPQLTSLWVEGGATLNITASSTGSLTAIADSSDGVFIPAGMFISGILNIYGGTITAGGNPAIRGYGLINIYGGNVTARGKSNVYQSSGGTGLGGNVNIYGGTITASGSQYGINGNIIISGGIVTATSPGNIGRGIESTLKTTEKGNAIIRASSINESEMGNWSGVIFNGDSGKIYGNPNLEEILIVREGESLTIPENGNFTHTKPVYLDWGSMVSGTIPGEVRYQVWNRSSYNVNFTGTELLNEKQYAAENTNVGVSYVEDGHTFTFTVTNFDETPINFTNGSFTMTGQPVRVDVRDNNVPYLDSSGNNMTCSDAVPVTSDLNAWNSGWYAVAGDVVISNRIVITGDVHLILMDGAKLTAIKGITVNDDDNDPTNECANKLTIYAQSKGDHMGKLLANKEYASLGEFSAAGIGGENNNAGGTITINGGNIESYSGQGAGIGSGSLYSANVKAAGTITINGGKVTANSSNGAAIGGGLSGSGGQITINGGEVTVNSWYGAGIGGGQESVSGGVITINDGDIEVSGDRGIGGHYTGGTIVINGGDITSSGVIGNYSYSSYFAGDKTTSITINGGKVAVTINSSDSAAIGGKGGPINVNITGGEVIAENKVTYTSTSATAIGSGYDSWTEISYLNVNVNIIGGSVTAIVNNQNGVGIGCNAENAMVSFNTKKEDESPGNAFIIASSFTDISNQADWSGIIFGAEKDKNDNLDKTIGKVYGNPALKASAIVPENYILVVPEESTINTNDKLTNNGAILNMGTIEGQIKGIEPQSLPQLTASYGQTLANVTFPNEDWAWEDSSTTLNTLGTNTFPAVFKDKVKTNVEVAVEKATPSYTISASPVTYGEAITITVTPNVMGASPAIKNLLMDVPAANQMAIFKGETQLTEPQTVNDSTLTFTISGFDVGTHELIAKYVGNDNVNDVKQKFEVTVNKKQLTIASATLADKTYDGRIYGTVTDLTLSGLVDDETLILNTDYTASAKYGSADAGTNKTAEVRVTLEETEKAKNYSLPQNTFKLENLTISKAESPAAPEVTGNYAIDSTDTSKFSYTVIVVNPSDGVEYEYQMDDTLDGQWRSSNVFTGIEVNSKHTFYSRIKETDNVNAGLAGNTGEITFLNIPAIDNAIAQAIASKEGIIVEDKEANQVQKDIKFVSTSVMNVLDTAIRTAEDAKKTVKSDTDVKEAVNTLNEAVNAFMNAIQIGTYSPSSGVRPSTPDSSGKTETGDKVKVEEVKTEEEVKEILGKDNIITTVQIDDVEEPVEVTVKAGRKNADETVYVVQQNKETDQLELVAITQADEKGNVTFTTDSKEKLVLTRFLPDGFIGTVNTKNKPSVTYYVKDNKIIKGWILIDNNWYFFDYETGVQRFGWVAEYSDWYYLDEKGIMKTNYWVFRDADSAYYVGADGKMWVGPAVTPDGYNIDSRGLWHR